MKDPCWLQRHHRLRVRHQREPRLRVHQPEHRHRHGEAPVRHPVWVRVELRLLRRERRLVHHDRLLEHRLQPGHRLQQGRHQRPRRGLVHRHHPALRHRVP